MENYLVNPDYSAQRKADYETGKYLNSVFKPITQKECFKIEKNGLNGNIHSNIIVNLGTKEAEIGKRVEDVGSLIKGVNSIPLYEAISSALALYRTICIIENPIVESEGANGYKVPYSIYLKHEPTGRVLSISEWKGAFGVWTPFLKESELPLRYKVDMLKLLNLILSDTSPHPYDGTTAGSVA